MIRLSLMAAAILGGVLGAGGAFAQTGEKLDRGLVALRQADGSVYLGWRFLADDAGDAAFDVYRRTGAGSAAERITAKPIRESTNFVDTKAPADARYSVAAVTAGKEGDRSAEIAPSAAPGGTPCLRIPLQGGYAAQKAAVGDLDGDGRYDFVIKQPDFNADPYQQPGYWKKSEEPYQIEAYSADGKFLWRHGMGWAIEEGIWYSPYVVYDLDGDGKAEVYAKGGEGDPRDPDGRVTSGPEWLYRLDGLTGTVTKKIPWPDREGLGDYNYYSRNLLAVAYLDGKRPHLIVQRGTYRAIKVEAYDGALNLAWRWDSTKEKERYDGQGAHTLHAADVDGDGCDEIVLGSAVLDHGGKGLWTLGIGHPDACYVGDIDPSRPGLEIFFGIEPRQKRGAVRLVEAATGKTIWANEEPTVHVHGQGLCADILAEHPGQECYAGEAKGGDQFWMFTAAGRRIGSEDIGGLAPWTLWWDGDPQKEVVLRGKITKFKGEALQGPEGTQRHVLVADILGDWREELITTRPGELRI